MARGYVSLLRVVPCFVRTRVRIRRQGDGWTKRDLGGVEREAGSGAGHGARMVRAVFVLRRLDNAATGGLMDVCVCVYVCVCVCMSACVHVCICVYVCFRSLWLKSATPC